MLTYENCEDLLTQCFLQKWNNETLVLLKNQKQIRIPNTSDSWIRFSILRSSMGQSSFGAIGNRRYYRKGRIYIQIFVASGTKTNRLNELCGKVIDIYEGIDLPNFRVIRITQNDLLEGANLRDKVSGDGTWFGSVVSVYYTFDEIK